MIALCARWELQQVAIKFAAPDVSLVRQGALRSTCAAAPDAFGHLLPGVRLTLGSWSSPRSSALELLFVNALEWARHAQA
ncbi:MAG: hypothetical protein ABI593_12565 [Betaproteobacteria bacterium]